MFPNVISVYVGVLDRQTSVAKSISLVSYGREGAFVRMRNTEMVIPRIRYIMAERTFSRSHSHTDHFPLNSHSCNNSMNGKHTLLLH